MDEVFYDIVEQTKYQITISKPEKMEDLSDLFVTKEELIGLIGERYFHGAGPHTTTLSNVVAAEVKAWGEKLVSSGKKTLLITDDDLLDVLKQGYLSDYGEGDTRFGRHGDRICYTRQFKRKKTKVTQGDVNHLWDYLFYGFRERFSVYPSHVPRYDRGVNMFKAYKTIVGWRRVRKHMSKTYVKFYRQIWDNPEEHIR